MDELLKIHNNTMNDMMNEYKINLHTIISRIIEKEENNIHNYEILPKNKIRRKKALRNSMLCQKNSNAFILNLNLTAMVPMLQRCGGNKERCASATHNARSK